MVALLIWAIVVSSISVFLSFYLQKKQTERILPLKIYLLLVALIPLSQYYHYDLIDYVQYDLLEIDLRSPFSALYLLPYISYLFNLVIVYLFFYFNAIKIFGQVLTLGFYALLPPLAALSYFFYYAIDFLAFCTLLYLFVRALKKHDKDLVLVFMFYSIWLVISLLTVESYGIWITFYIDLILFDDYGIEHSGNCDDLCNQYRSQSQSHSPFFNFFLPIFSFFASIVFYIGLKLYRICNRVQNRYNTKSV